MRSMQPSCCASRFSSPGNRVAARPSSPTPSPPTSELGDPLRFDTKSVSEASHLFYRYDAVAHFRASQVKETEATPYLEMQALGKAIVLANPPTNELVELMDVTDPWTAQGAPLF